MFKSFLHISIALFLVLLIHNNLLAQETSSNKDPEHIEEHQEKEGFNPGTFIFEHIRDNYNWHLWSYKGHHVA
ncbi:hypothetical protein ACFLS4_06570, partial [Bacteroidota bacterium]